MRVAINGFGRIGRAAFHIMIERGNDYAVVALNDLSDTKTLAHLLKYDTVYGHFPGDVSYTEKSLVVNGKEYPLFSEQEPARLPWRQLGVDVVIESTGIFRTSALAKPHIDAGAKRVIITAPPKSDDIETLVMGVNHESGKKDATIVSNASCTTNCIAPVATIMHNTFGITKAAMTTIHSYTADQRLVDGSHKDLRRARAAAQNIVPTTTGAAVSTAQTIPELKGLFDGMAIRVPTITGSLSDVTMLLSKKVTVDEVNSTFKKAASHPLYKDIIAVTEDPIVSSDIVGSTYSAIIDLSLTKVIDGDLVKVIAWYDNEWGYANRLVDMAKNIMNN